MLIWIQYFFSLLVRLGKKGKCKTNLGRKALFWFKDLPRNQLWKSACLLLHENKYTTSVHEIFNHANFVACINFPYWREYLMKIRKFNLWSNLVALSLYFLPTFLILHCLPMKFSVHLHLGFWGWSTSIKHVALLAQ